MGAARHTPSPNGMGRCLAGFRSLRAVVDSVFALSRALRAERRRYSRPGRRLTARPWRPLDRLVYPRLLEFLGRIPRVATARHGIYPTCLPILDLSRPLCTRQKLGTIFRLLAVSQPPLWLRSPFLSRARRWGFAPDYHCLPLLLVVLSPPVMDCWLLGVANAHEPLATVLVAGAFLAVVARRDFLCLMFLFAALLTKENAVWAPAAAAITIMLRPKPDEPLRRQVITAAVMFLPVVFWLGLRFAFFGGIGGTYATAGYRPLGNFLALTFQKLTHLDALFVGQHAFVTEGHGALLDRAIRLGTRLLTYALFSLLALRIVREIANRFRYAMTRGVGRPWTRPFSSLCGPRLPSRSISHSPCRNARYATSVVVFAWPALVAEIDRRRQAVIWLGLTVLCVVSALRSYRSGEIACCSDPTPSQPDDMDRDAPSTNGNATGLHSGRSR